MCLFNNQTAQIFTNKKFKIITGLNNLNILQIMYMLNIANIANVSYVDVASNFLLVREVKKYTKLPICVSSINLKELNDCVVEGSGLIEIGNYDYFYKNDIVLSEKHIIKIVKQALFLFPKVPVCVTIPYFLSIKQKMNLSIQLEQLGVSILQTENVRCNIIIDNNFLSVTSLIKVALPVLSSAYVISKVVSIPIIASSGVNSLLSSLTLLCGASGIGVGTLIRRCSDNFKGIVYAQEVKQSMRKIVLISSSNNLFISKINNLHVI